MTMINRVNRFGRPAAVSAAAQERSVTWKAWIARVVAVGAVLGVWAFATRQGGVSPIVLPSITAVLRGIVTFLSSVSSWQSIFLTMIEIVAAFAISASLGLAIGFISSWSRISSVVVERLLAWGYMYPFVLMYPLFILTLGVGPASKIGFGAVTATVPVAFNCLRGIKSVDRRYLAVGRAFGATKIQMDLLVKFGAARPLILSGFRVGAGMVSVSVIFAELLGSYSGVGHYIQASLNALDIPSMYGAIVILVLLSVLYQKGIDRMFRGGRHGVRDK